ncbi:MAG TPA: ATP-dependent DNA ligase [Acidobacteriaceae bacterium]|nr:ATP-dependent DNA ligase [Acidobacteriaceae bacterium]
MTAFAQLAMLAEEMEHTSSRLKKRAAIAKALRATHDAAPEANDAGLFALYLSGAPFAECDQRKLNAGGALLSKAVLAVSGATDAALTAAYRRHGDLGAAAFDLLTERAAKSREAADLSAATTPLTLADVADAFAAMAAARTTAARAAFVDSLLRRATPLEAKYLLKLMLGDMRIGVKQSLVEEAIAQAASIEEHEPKPATAATSQTVTPQMVRHAVMLEADLAGAVRRAFAGTLAEARMRLFHPLGFMLASPVDSPEEAVQRFSANEERTTESEQRIEAFLEDKYDGMRAQLHCADPAQPGRVAIYSRNREDITESFPELAEAFSHVGPAQTGALILDGEILGWDYGPGDESAETAHALPFAVLGQRIGRKRVENEWRAKVPVIFMAFDLLCERGELTLHLPLRERRNRLEAIVEKLSPHTTAPLEINPHANDPQASLFSPADAGTPGLDSETWEGRPLPRLLLAPSRLVESAEDIDRAYAAARARSNEGVMIKAADSTYQPGRRGLAWVKLKRELATLDVVITGAEYGHGKRAGLLSDYTFAVRGPDYGRNGELLGGLLNVGKAYSGVTDAEIAELTIFLKEHTLSDFGHFRTVEPLIVLEVAFNNIMRSDRHNSGFALRFPRILRLRPDKPVAETDTLARVEDVYESQVDKPESQVDKPGS